MELPLEEQAEEGIAESAGSDCPGGFLGGFGKRVEAELGESLALPGAEIGFRLPHILPVEFVGELPQVGRTGDEEAGMSGEILDFLPGGGQVDRVHHRRVARQRRIRRPGGARRWRRRSTAASERGPR